MIDGAGTYNAQTPNEKEAVNLHPHGEPRQQPHVSHCCRIEACLQAMVNNHRSAVPLPADI